MDQTNIQQHVFTRFGNALTELLDPLTRDTAINYFAPSRVYLDGARSYLVPDSKWGEHLLKNNDHLAGVGESLVSMKQKGFEFWSASSMFLLNAQSRALYQDLVNANYHKGITLLEGNDDYVEMFHISVAINTPRSEEYIIKNLDSLWKLVLAFREKLSQHPELSEAYAKKHYYGVLPADNFIQPLPKVDCQHQINRYYLGGEFKKVYFTRREINCMRLAARNMTDKMISKSLDISYRTVEAHMSHIKEKSATKSRAELIEKLQQNVCFNALNND